MPANAASRINGFDVASSMKSRMTRPAFIDRDHDAGRRREQAHGYIGQY